MNKQKWISFLNDVIIVVQNLTEIYNKLVELIRDEQSCRTQDQYVKISCISDLEKHF